MQTCESDAVTCVPIECAIRGLQGGNNVRIDITGFLDERSFAVSFRGGGYVGRARKGWRGVGRGGGG